MEFYLPADFRPDLFSWDRVVKMSPLERLEHAFSKAQTYLGIEKLLDPEGIVPCLISTLIFPYNFEYLKHSFSLFLLFRKNCGNLVFSLLKCGGSYFIANKL